MAMTLALMMVLTVAISVSAATVTNGGTYGGYSYETIDTCNTKSFSSRTFYDSMEYSIYSNVTVYGFMIDASGNELSVPVAYYNGDPGYTVTNTSGSVAFAIAGILCEHYINNCKVYSINVYPS